jgi:hypothetical protein
MATPGSWTDTALFWSLWVAAAVLTAVVLSHLSPRLIAIFRDLAQTLADARIALTKKMEEFVAPRWQAFWHRRTREPLEPVLAGLARINRAAANLGQAQIARLAEHDNELAGRLDSLKSAAAPRPPDIDDRQRITRSIASGGIGKLFVLAFFAIVVGATNAALLNVFFREFLGTRSPIPTLLPSLQLGHVLAALFFLIEIGTGVFIHAYGAEKVSGEASIVRTARTDAHRFYYAGAWGALAFLALVELFAYAVLSDRLEITRQLSIASDSPMFPIARFFFATFGLALTLILSAIGHSFAEAVEHWKRARVERQLVRALERRDESIVRNVQQVRESLDGIAKTAAALPPSTAESFSNHLHLRDPFPGAPTALYLGTMQVLGDVEPEARALVTTNTSVLTPRIRTSTQVIADIAVGLVALAAVATAAVLVASQSIAWLVATAGFSSRLSLGLGLFMPAAGLALGTLARNALKGMRFASTAEQLYDHPNTRTAYGWIMVFGVLALALSSGVLTASAMNNAVLGTMAGSIPMLVLCLLAGMLDRSLVSLGHSAYLSWLASVRVMTFAMIAVSHLLTWMGVAVQYVLRLLAVPGDAIRSLFSKRPVPASAQ